MLYLNIKSCQSHDKTVALSSSNMGASKLADVGKKIKWLFLDYGYDNNKVIYKIVELCDFYKRI